jgi:two-component system, LytTR family, response regulator
MPNYRVLIVDDEPISRRRLRRLLALEAECELMGECENGMEAVHLLEREKIDIVFLDVQMPEMDGFEVVHAISRAHPLIIFTSAYDEYALKAFEVHAFDYLLKPFDRRRFRESVQRARAQLTQSKPPVSTIADDRILTLFENLASARNAPDRIAIRNNGRVIFLKLNEIDWIEAADNYVCLHCGRDTHILRETMSELEARLDPARFIRVHRSAIVNLDCIRELQPWFRGDYKVMLNNGTELTLTKNHREKLESRLLLGAR